MEAVRWVAAEVLVQFEAPEGDEYVITGVERVSQTWVVHYQSRRHLESGEIRHARAGNGPIRVTGDYTTTVADTALPTEHFVAEFESRGGETLDGHP